MDRIDNQKPEEQQMLECQMEIIKKQCPECSSNDTIQSETELYCKGCGGYYVK